MDKENVYTGFFCEGISEFQKEQAMVCFAPESCVDWNQESCSPTDLFASGEMVLKGNGFDSFFCLPLDAMPILLPPPFVAAALITRTEPLSYLSILKGSLDNTQDLFLKSGSQIAVDSQLILSQFKHLRSDLGWTISEGMDTKVHEMDAFLSKNSIQHVAPDEWETFVLSPFECIPKPGAGALVLVCHEQNLDLRKRLRNLHVEEVAKCTNTERRLLKMLPSELSSWFGAYCARDGQSNYQMIACLAHSDHQLFTWKYSSSGVLAVENYMITQIQKWISMHWTQGVDY